MTLGYAWFDSYDSVGYVLTLHIFPTLREGRVVINAAEDLRSLTVEEKWTL